ncbi:hypothetical protein A3D71_00275 [Candidatus Kaiserbacteria bacterium RIFCSPHIGHO2_02_FULL_55_20]|uniref:Uncharacterized protein n=1 Tax=Candidatus Kaiserbacteria bacterium RIFCSPHIGHO2_02_FULL_55_20 TaxID=1798497 RepID=A0A1F6DX06_9BACT|nr:MAG: hypothetical protein A2680_03195 [Candidatus Kaiserbacteria bacterium RIFCSPHIGHO2_01_FULL_55_37]OGG65522.1 MAG: hypothetical protein A3D71_00275 [Candidatus Kaiserbacteria bacterium RIFCSPHIGHO2_02_FULL_55_20]
MNIRTNPQITIGVCALLFACILVYASIEYTAIAQERAALFFSSTLRENNIVETVFVEGVRYEVVDGTIVSEHWRPSSFDRYRALRVAYALALAKRSPLLGISGVDPDSLEKSVSELASSTRALADVQKDPRDVALVRDSLYPLDFLNKLASQERVRQRFISSGSNADERGYELSIKKTIDAGQADAERFARSLKEEAGDASFRFATLGGMITRDTLLSSARTVVLRFKELNGLAHTRERCLDGIISLCDIRDVIRTVPEPVEPIGDAPFVTLRTGADLDLAKNNVRPVLSKSVCLAEEPGPYVFAYGNPRGVSLMPLRYIRELYFRPTEHFGSAMQYMRNELRIDYAPVNPIEFYQCPDVLSDIGGVYAILGTVRFAQSHPYAPEERTRLLSSTTYRDSDAIAYLRAAATEVNSDGFAGSDATLKDLETVLNMWRERNGGLDALVSLIVSVNNQDMKLSARGVPFDLRAHTLILTHSAFPSLFLALSPRTGVSPITLRETTATDATAIHADVIPYTELARTVPREKIVHDLDAFLLFEGIKIP